jgi:hypothetical protein
MAYLSIIIIHSSLYLCGQQSMRLPRRFAPRNDIKVFGLWFLVFSKIQENFSAANALIYLFSFYKQLSIKLKVVCRQYLVFSQNRKDSLTNTPVHYVYSKEVYRNVYIL